LKRRGLIGVMADALAAHVLPIALVFTLVSDSSMGHQGELVGLGIAASGWSLLTGIRCILIHQIGDRFLDKKVEVETFATIRDPQIMRTFLLRYGYPFEVICFVVFTFILVGAEPVFLVVIAVYVCLEAKKYISREPLPMFLSEEPPTERYVPLWNNAFYECWMPCGVLLLLPLHGWSFAWLGGVHLILFWPNLLGRVQDSVQVLRGCPCQEGR
ncbi:MAG: hypothetical protein ABGX16_06635, partial [Pirellulales bacterium]